MKALLRKGTEFKARPPPKIVGRSKDTAIAIIYSSGSGNAHALRLQMMVASGCQHLPDDLLQDGGDCIASLGGFGGCLRRKADFAATMHQPSRSEERRVGKER